MKMLLTLYLVTVAYSEDLFLDRLRRDGCTMMIFGRLATASGFPAVTHANDCAECDNRMVFVEARDYPKTAKRAIYNGAYMSFPRSGDVNRSLIYSVASPTNFILPIGHIPQASHTFALWESAYPLMNEHGLAFGESTTSAKAVLATAGRRLKIPSDQLSTPNPPSNGTALFSIAQLMAIALERCKTAKCAIVLMGTLAEHYGFYGESFGASEAVGVVDRKDAWVFEVTGTGSNGTTGEDETSGKFCSRPGALWAAQRVPEEHVAVVANSMTIGLLPDCSVTRCKKSKSGRFYSTRNFIFSSSINRITTELGLWREGKPFEWRSIMSSTPEGHPLYAALRMWRVYSRVANLFRSSLTQEDQNLLIPPATFLPFSVPVAAPLSLEEIFDLHRDHFEGTPFDMTQGIMAGPWGNPNYEMTGLELKAGETPRAISILRTSYTQVSITGPIPTIWFAPDAPATSVFVPFFASTSEASEEYGDLQGPSLKSFDRKYAFWAFDFVANWMGLNYGNMSAEIVYPARDELQAWVLEEVEQALGSGGGFRRKTEARNDKTEIGVTEKESLIGKLESYATSAIQRLLNGRSLTSSEEQLPSTMFLQSLQIRIQKEVTKQWNELADLLIVRYNDGFFNFAPDSPEVQGIPLPTWWLRMIGFSRDFVYPGNHWARPAGRDAKLGAQDKVGKDPLRTLLIGALLGMVFVFGFIAGRQQGVSRRGILNRADKHSYSSL